MTVSKFRYYPKKEVIPTGMKISRPFPPQLKLTQTQHLMDNLVMDMVCLMEKLC